MTISAIGGAPGGADFWGVVAASPLIKRIVFDEADSNASFPDSNIGFDSFRFFPPPGAPPAVVVIGTGCGVSGDLGATPLVIGEPATLSLSGAPANVFGWFIVAWPIVAPTPIGGGCSLNVDASFSILGAFTTSGSGATSFTGTVPADATLSGFTFGAQAIEFAGGPGPGGLGSTSGLQLTIGN